MSIEQNCGWENLFGSSETDKIPQDAMSLLMGKKISDIPSQIENLLPLFGKDLINRLKIVHEILQIKNIQPSMRHQVEETYEILAYFAKNDVEHLMRLKNALFKISHHLINEEAINKIRSNVIPSLDNLIKKQVKLLRKSNCSIVTQNDSFKESILKDFEQELLAEINAGDYLSALMELLYFNSPIPSHMADNIHKRAKDAAKKHPIHSKDFMDALKLRLFSPNAKNPKNIDYSSLTNNKLLQDPNIKALKDIDAGVLSSLYEGFESVSNQLCEEKLKAQFQIQILEPLKSLLQSIN